MPFTAPSWVPPLPTIPDSISIGRFMFDEQYGRYPLGYSKPPFTCALTGRQFSALEMKERVDHLSRALCKEFGFKPNEGSEWDKVIGIFSLNSIDYLTLGWAVHRIGGILTCANAAYNGSELEYQFRDSGAKAIFTCLPLLDTTKDGMKKAGLSEDNIYVMPLPKQIEGDVKSPGHKTIEDLVKLGSTLDTIKPADESWAQGDGKKRCAFLCYSSGTSGLPKGVMISHYNVIANTLQINTHEELDRQAMIKQTGDTHYTENCLGLLPMSHIYGLIVIAHVGPYRGDGVVVLPKYDFNWLLQAIQDYKIHMLYLVPPMIIHITKAREICAKYDLSSVRGAFTGAAPLGKETADDLSKMYPKWAVRQGYGMTETATVVCSTMPHDIWFGSSGSLLPGISARLVTVEGNEITGYDQPGELWVKGPAVVLGYLNNEKANKETFLDEPDGRYMRTGDEAVVAKSPQGHEHIFITDRIKELIKCKGHQVAPAELEAHLLTHPAVNDTVVIGIPAEREGEVPKAFVVKTPNAKGSDDEIAKSIKEHVEKHKSNYKWLRGGVEFIEVVPKSPSGKILRRLMRDQEKEKMKKAGVKL
ncbi:phenylacetyl-CoA ligase like protein [Zymoseptoria brevis]|uniref:Phenylacetyl-CoA ligase like protein n=1 Tax=Zymoseptoria brevis TaxID=1047168 RepID=A0A0F4GZ04_9PEZI|nr:phenylacetyl-CoA ligase like protein [Zymoseptoria brevis]